MDARVYSELLYDNLKLLFLKHHVRDELQKIIHEEIFILPNKAVFEELVCYLYKIIDCDKYGSKLVWPFISKKMENDFYTKVHSLSRQISEEYPEEDIPKVTKSFFQSSFGLKFICFMHKLSIIAMKNVVRRQKVGGVKFLPRPKDEESLNHMSAVVESLMYNQRMFLEEQRDEDLHWKTVVRSLRADAAKKTRLIDNVKRLVEEMIALENFCTQWKDRLLDLNDHTIVHELNAIIENRYIDLRQATKCVKEMKINLIRLNRNYEKLKACKNMPVSDFNTSFEFNTKGKPEIIIAHLDSNLSDALNNLKEMKPKDVSEYLPKLEELSNRAYSLLSLFREIQSKMISFYDRMAHNNPCLDNRREGHNEFNLNLLWMNTPPEVFRTMDLAQLKDAGRRQNHHQQLLQDTTLNTTPHRNIAHLRGTVTPPRIETTMLKPLSLEPKLTASTWKNRLLISTLKKQQVQGSSVVTTAGMESEKRSGKPIRSLNAFWTDEPDIHETYNSLVDSNELTSDFMGVTITCTSESGITEVKSQAQQNSTEETGNECIVKPQQIKKLNLSDDQNVSQDVHDILQAVERSYGSISNSSITVSSHFEYDDFTSGTELSPDVAELSLANWDDTNNLGRIASSVLSPLGNFPLQIASSTPLTTKSEFKTDLLSVKERSKNVTPVDQYVSKIPKSKALESLRNKIRN